MEKINQEIADILEVDSLADTDSLEATGMWDSLAKLSVISVIDTEYGINLFQADIDHIKTLADIKDIIKSKQ